MGPPVLDRRKSESLSHQSQIAHVPLPNFSKDLNGILVLLILYFLQGMISGLIHAMPLILQGQGFLYHEQAIFSLTKWPLCLKLIYAPIIDTMYWKKLGRRKSWLGPFEYLISILLLVIALMMDDLSRTKNINLITFLFFVLNLLAASLDVVIDGWGLSILSPENVGFASGCSIIGRKVLGVSCGSSILLLILSKEFGNKFRESPQEFGLVGLPQVLVFMALFISGVTTLILTFKEEKEEPLKVQEQHMNISGTYRSLWRILRLPNLRLFGGFLLTSGIWSAALHGLTTLKLVDQGISRDTIAYFSLALIPVNLIFPVIGSKWIVGPEPLTLYMRAVPLRLLLGLCFPGMILAIPSIIGGREEVMTYCGYLVLFLLFSINLILEYLEALTRISFINQVADPSIGGTYTTLLHTISYLGHNWPSTLALSLIESLGIIYHSSEPECLGPRDHQGSNSSWVKSNFLQNLGNSSTHATYANESYQNSTLLTRTSVPFEISSCSIVIDGYFIESLVCFGIGILWFLWARPVTLRLQRRNKLTWRIVQS